MPRWVHRLYAFLCGYFWLRCPRCGEMFGGHEIVPFGGNKLVDGRMMSCCPNCHEQDCQMQATRIEHHPRVPAA